MVRVMVCVKIKLPDGRYIQHRRSLIRRGDGGIEGVNVAYNYRGVNIFPVQMFIIRLRLFMKNQTCRFGR
jgi:hypothetical protein